MQLFVRGLDGRSTCVLVGPQDSVLDLKQQLEVRRPLLSLACHSVCSSCGVCCACQPVMPCTPCACSMQHAWLHAIPQPAPLLLRSCTRRPARTQQAAHGIPVAEQLLTSLGGRPLPSDPATPLGSAACAGLIAHGASLQLLLRLAGGKGGFGAC
jgi:hypothetical protein